MAFPEHSMPNGDPSSPRIEPVAASDGQVYVGSLSPGGERFGIPALVVRGTRRAGEVLRVPANVVVLGNVNPGAQIVAEGDILVYGSLRGMAHAGAAGDSTAVIIATSTGNPDLRIAEHVCSTDDLTGGSRGANDNDRRAVIVRVQNRSLRVSAYLKNHSICAGGWRRILTTWLWTARRVSSRGFRNAIAAAREALVVTTPEVSAIRDADRVIGLLHANDIRHARLIINRIKPEMVRQGDMMDSCDVLEMLGVEAIGLVPADDRVITSTNNGTLVVYDTQSASGREFVRIAARLDGEHIPLIEPIEERSGSIMDKVRYLMGINRRASANV